jgi:hypothetical protein
MTDKETITLKTISLDRRAFLRSSGYFSLLTFTPASLLADIAQQNCKNGTCIFFNREQIKIMNALCAHFIPGPPDDPDPGALEAGVPQYIDLLLGAFMINPVRIHAGGPFSMRDVAGQHNSFMDFLPLDAIEERSWRTRIEGSKGLPEREWNGPVKGWQQTYIDGLRLLDEKDFVNLSSFRKRWLLRTAKGELGEFLDLAFKHTLEGMYGAPEYGGNINRVGWANTHWPGDYQPMMYTNEQVSYVDADQFEAEQQAKRNAEDYLS